MGNYTIFLMFENPRRSRQARHFTENDPKILELKSSSEQIIFRKLSLGAPDSITFLSNNTKPSAPTKKVTSHSHVILGVPPAGTSTDQGSYPFELFKFHDFP